MYLGTKSGDVHFVTNTLSEVVSKYGVCTVLQQGVYYPGDSPAANSLMMLHELGNSGRNVASFVCYQGSYIRQGYQFIDDRPDFARPTPPGFDMELDNEMDDSVRTVNMIRNADSMATA